MKPWFERVYHTEPPSEGDFEREHKSIELSDEEIVLRDEAIRAVDMKLKNGDFDLLPPYPLTKDEPLDAVLVIWPWDESTVSDALKNKYEIANQKLASRDFDLTKDNAKNKRNPKSTKKAKV